MAKPLKIGRLRIIFAKSPPLLKIAVAAALAVCTVAVLTLRISIVQAQKKNESLKAQSVAYAKENRELQQWLADVGTEKSVRRIASAELGLVDPDSRFFIPED